MCKASQDIFKIIGFRHAAPLQGRDAMPRVFLPASKTVKDIHAEHVVPCLANDNKVRVASISVFRYIWKSCFPHVEIMSVCTDVCAKCEKDRQSVSSAVGNLENKPHMVWLNLHWICRMLKLSVRIIRRQLKRRILISVTITLFFHLLPSFSPSSVKSSSLYFRFWPAARSAQSCNKKCIFLFLESKKNKEKEKTGLTHHRDKSGGRACLDLIASTNK